MGKRANQPPPTMWIARVVADPPNQLPAGTPAERTKRRLLRQSIWASREEAVSYLLRKLPETLLPPSPCIHPGSSIVGEVIPAHSQSMFTTTAGGDGAVIRQFVIPHYADLTTVTPPAVVDEWPPLDDDEDAEYLDDLVLAA